MLGISNVKYSKVSKFGKLNAHGLKNHSLSGKRSKIEKEKGF